MNEWAVTTSDDERVALVNTDDDGNTTIVNFIWSTRSGAFVIFKPDTNEATFGFFSITSDQKIVVRNSKLVANNSDVNAPISAGKEVDEAAGDWMTDHNPAWALEWL